VPFNFLWGDQRRRIVWLREVALEVCVTNHLFKVGTCLGVAEETLREEENELIEKKRES
jgi:hypothetical protein